jgi:hypothetical protein
LVWTPSPQGADRVTVWASQLAAGDFPYVCAMTGQPAETSRKFRFSTSPWWTLVFLLLLCVGIGFFVSIPLAYLVSRRASGRLPLTHRSKRLLDLPMRAAIAILALSAVLGIITAIALSRPYDPANPTPEVIGVLLFNSGVVAFLFGAILLQGTLLGRFPIGPGAKVMKVVPGQPDRVVELIRVHPAFVAAVRRMRAAPLPESAETN